MLALLTLLSAGSAPACGFNGGALVGAQVGFSCMNLNVKAKEKGMTKEAAAKVADAAIAAASGNVDLFTTDAATDKNSTKTTDGKTDVYVTIPAGKAGDADVIAKAIADELKQFKDSSELTISSMTFKVDAADAAAYNMWFGPAAGAPAVAPVRALANSVLDNAFKKSVLTDIVNGKDAFVKARVAVDAAKEYTSNNGFAGLHLGYLGRVNDKFLVGGLAEGNWVFGQDIKNKDDSNEKTETSARINMNLFLRAMFNLTEKFMVGADVGASFQEFRTLKEVGKTDKESKWFWGPAARFVLGVAFTDNILATAHIGGVFPIEQDSFKTIKDVKTKYSNIHGGVGISYAFGG